MGKVWLEDIIPDDFMAKSLDPAPTLTLEEVRAAEKETRVPPVIYDAPLTDRALNAWDRSSRERKAKTAGFDAIDHIGRFIPAVSWLRTYKWRAWFLWDLAAGIAVAVMVIPQGMSYAQNLAFLPQVYGLYGAFVPCLIYGALGSSRHVSVGPVAVTSLLLGSGLTGIFGEFQVNPSDPNDAYQADLQDRFNRGAIQISFLAGLMYTCIGLFRLGWIVNFLSQAVISGFMTGAASIIVCTQLKYITGQYYLPRTDTVWDSLKVMFDNMYLFRYPEFGMGFCFILFLILCQVLGARYRRLYFLRFSGPIIVTIVALIVQAAGGYYEVDYTNKNTPIIKDVGPMPAGLPAVTTSWWFPLYDTSAELILAAVICVLDIAESTTVARRYAQEHKYKLNFTQELRALGIANLVGACFNCYTTTGAFSRTAVNSIAGARTLMSSFVCGIVIMIVLLVGTPLFKHLPLNVQGAIVIVAVLSLFDFKSGAFYYRVNKLDFLSWLVAYLVTAFAGALPGIAAAVALSIVIFLLRAAFPNFSQPAPLPGGDAYADPEVFPGAAAAAPAPGVAVVRVEAPLFFANLDNFKDHVESVVARRRREGDAVRALVLDLGAVTEMDGSVAYTFDYFVDELATEGVALVLAAPSHSVLLTLQRSRLNLKVRPENVQLTVAEGVARARGLAAAAIAADAEKAAAAEAQQLDAGEASEPLEVKAGGKDA